MHRGVHPQDDAPHVWSTRRPADSQSGPAPGVPSVDTIRTHIEWWTRARNLPVPSDLDQTFSDAGFDSLHFLELAFFLERRLGTEISDTALYELPTFTSLIAYLADSLRHAASPQGE